MEKRKTTEGSVIRARLVVAVTDATAPLNDAPVQFMSDWPRTIHSFDSQDACLAEFPLSF